MFETLQATSRIILFLEILLVIPEKESQTFFCGDKSHLQKLYEIVSGEVTF